MLKIPARPAASSQGYSPEFLSSGAFRTQSYRDWCEDQAAKAGMEGRSWKPGVDAPERKPDGTLDGGGSHRAESPEEIIQFFSKMMRASDTLEADKRKLADLERANQAIGDLGELAKKAAGGDGAALHEAIQRSVMALRASDPNIVPQPYVTPGDFAAEFATPLDTTELIVMCDETGLYRALPEITEDTKTELWREINELEFISGCNFIAFEAGGCPEEFRHDGDNRFVDLKHIGVKKTLSESDIRHSMGSIAAGYGIRELVGGFNDGGLPGEGGDMPSLIRGNIASVKEKEMRLGSILTLNGWDDLLVNGDEDGNSEEFDGMVELLTAANGARANGGTTTGTFNVNHIDQFMAAGCARPDAIIGHPAALAAISLGYFGLGSSSIFYSNNDKITPGLHFSGEIMTGFGPVALIGDSRFPRTEVAADSTFRSTVYPVKMRHNGESLIYKRTQIPLSMKDLAPGCTAVSFEIWAVTALIIKAMCAQSAYSGVFAGVIDDSCALIHDCA